MKNSSNTITQKHKDAISEIYLLSIIAPNTVTKLGILADLYAAIYAALTKSDRIDAYNKRMETVEADLKSAWDCLKRASDYHNAEKYILDVKRILTFVGFQEEYIAVKTQNWSITTAFRSPAIDDPDDERGA